VLHPGLRLMPAIRRHRCPAELERQERKQNEYEESTHDRECSGCRVYLVAAEATEAWGFTIWMRGCPWRPRRLPSALVSQGRNHWICCVRGPPEDLDRRTLKRGGGCAGQGTAMTGLEGPGMAQAPGTAP
jgi:hypothetical protein